MVGRFFKLTILLKVEFRSWFSCFADDEPSSVVTVNSLKSYVGMITLGFGVVGGVVGGIVCVRSYFL